MKSTRIALLTVAVALTASCGAAADTGNTNFPGGAGLAASRALFLKNCAHCHGADAHGDEGPDLHNLDVSDEWIASRIRKGKAGEMTAFAGKLQAEDIATLVAYLRTLK